MKEVTGNNGGTLRQSEPGEATPGAGRPKGSRNRSTIARKWLETEEVFKNPITGQIEPLSQEDIITLMQINQARKGDTAAYKALLDSAHGRVPQPVQLTGADDGPIKIEQITGMIVK